jgi:hypothetical protein
MKNYHLPESDVASTQGIYNAAHRLHTSVEKRKRFGGIEQEVSVRPKVQMLMYQKGMA